MNLIESCKSCAKRLQKIFFVPFHFCSSFFFQNVVSPLSDEHFPEIFQNKNNWK